MRLALLLIGGIGAMLSAQARADPLPRIRIDVQHNPLSLRALASHEIVASLAEGLYRKCRSQCLLTLRVSGDWVEIDRSEAGYRKFLEVVRKAYCRRGQPCPLETELILIRARQHS